jgi:Competence protein CoiA-like family
MMYAIQDGERIEPIPQSRGECPLCQREVFSKCGEINIWHWAHLQGESCDGWYEPESEWHRDWKKIFGKENSEIIITKNDVRHIADIYTDSKVVIELQNSPIQKPVILKREVFYEERMLWLINGIHFKNNFSVFDRSADRYSRYSSWGSEYVKLYGGEFININTGEITSKPLIPEETHSFSWSWARKSWNGVQRPVFIDFGEDSLFWVKRGMGTSYGDGKVISKVAFIKKYGGNIDILAATSLIQKKQ